MTTTNKNFRVRNGLEVNGDGTFDGIVTTDAVQIDTTATITPSLGKIQWDSANETLQFAASNGDVNIQVGQEHVIRVKNNSGSVAIPDRTLVMFAGATGDTVKVTPAITSDVTTYPSDYIVGVTTQEIPADGFGFVTQFGFVNNVDTNGWTVGTLLYPDPATPGGFTSTKPTAPAWQTPIAAVTKQNDVAGRIFVRAIPGIQLNSVENVEISSPANNDVLKYNSTLGLWENGSVGGTGTVTSVALTVPTGLNITGSPITSSGSIDLTYSSGYAIPLSADVANGVTAYGWGDHSEAGYITSLGIGSSTQAWDADLDAIAALTGTSGFLKKTAADTWSLINSSFVVANGSNNIYYQTSAPSSPVAGDIWIDSDSGPVTIAPSQVTGTAITAADTGTVTNTMLAGSIENEKLSNSAITINGTSVSLGGSTTVSGGAADAMRGYYKLETGMYYRPYPETVLTQDNVSSANRGYMVPIVLGESVTFDRIAVTVAGSATAGSTARLAIYSSNSSGVPTTRVADYGTVDTSTTGAKSITISQTLSAGIYWIAISCSSTTPLFLSIGNNSAPQRDIGASSVPTSTSTNGIIWYADLSGGTYPATITATRNNYGSDSPVAWLRKA